jgi:ribosome-binding ATPase YchF (GTP1/OBG family)
MRHTLNYSLSSLLLILVSCSQNTESKFQEKIINPQLDIENFQSEVMKISAQIETIILKEKDAKSRLNRISTIQKKTKLPFPDFRKVMIKTMRKLNFSAEDEKFMIKSFDTMNKSPL